MEVIFRTFTNLLMKGEFPMFKRFLAVILSLIMLLSLVSMSGAEGATADPTNVYGGLVALDDANDPITFTLFVRDPGMEPAADNPVIKKIQELTGVTIDFEFLVGDLDQKIGVMTAGEDYPDAIFAGDASMKLIDAGAFIPLEDLIPNYPSLNAMYGNCMDALKAEDGHAYELEMYSVFRGNTVVDQSPIFECGLGFYIQKAVLADAGYVVPHTLDEYFDMIEAYLAKYPEIDGVKTSGFEILCDGWRNWALLNPAQNLMGDANDGAMFVDYQTYEPSFYQDTETAYNLYKKLNEEYRKGVINAETLTMSYDAYISKLTTGAVLGFYDQGWNFGSAIDLLKADGKYDRTYVAAPITNEGVRDGYIEGKNPDGAQPTGLNGIGITVNCKNPERLLKFYDWLLQRDVQDYILWGIEGEDWVRSENGTKEFTPERRALWRDSARRRDETGYTIWNYSPAWQGLYKSDGMPVRNDDSTGEYLASQSEYDQAFLKGFGIDYPAEMHSEPIVRPDYFPVWAMPLEDGSAAAIANTKITDVTTKYDSRLVLADDDEAFDKIWNEFLEEFHKIDLDALKDEVTRQINLKMGL